jgi:acyl dehydratase
MDVNVGDELPERVFPIDRLTLIRYAGASGDFNPIHWSERTARSVGLPDVIAHGMLTMAEAARLITDWTADPGALVEYGVRFSKPVVVPEETGAAVTVSGTVTATNDDGTAVVTLTARAGDGQKVLAQAKATVRISA